jgi:PAS domain S-box-containing protein
MWEKIVLNLLSNAFKFTFEGAITVTLQCRQRQVQLRVSDSGVGIPPAELPQVFHRFHRVKNARSRTHEGTGIGLALVQELVRLHGGEVAVESQEGRGTTFTVTIPAGNSHLPPNRIGGARQLASTNTRGAAFVEEALRWLPSNEADRGPLSYEPLVAPRLRSDGKAAAPARRARILVADDNADMRDYLRRLLERQYDVELLPDGRAALERIRADLPDLVLADVMMPRLDGFGLLAALRADDRTRAVPVLLLSARAGEEARIEGLQAGADAYLTKPFSARDLEAQISSQLQLARLRHESQQAIRYRSEQVATLLNQAPLGVYLVDADFRIRDVNPIALPVFGHFEGGIEGRDFAAVMRALWEPGYAEEVIAIFRRTLETGEPHITPEMARLRIDRGVTEYYEWRTDRITLPDGRFGVVCYFRDISAHVQIREELRDADQRKDEFLATLAHELRNPLATLKNGIQIIKVARDNREALDRTRDMMERQVSQVVRLIDDLLDVSRITYGKLALNISRVDLGVVIYRSIEMCSPMLEEMRHELTLSLPAEPVHLDADPVRLSQVLANLLNNACKFTPPGGKLAIKAMCESAPNPRITISVLDNGIGIPDEMLPRVFDLFVQSDLSLEKSHGGLGIGLTLVRRLVELHHGTVEVRSAGAGQGSEFLIHLPWAGPATNTEAHGAVAANENRASRVNARRILIVDDNRDSADSLAMLLSLHDEVSVAYDGREAIRMARELRPHVVLLDIAMPQMNGYEVARELRSQPWGTDMVLVALTGFGQATDKLKAEQGGFNAHLTKPVDLDALAGLLEKVSA